jgi:nitroimidazol reductase NimA-like FMN-containing flavoprotein (pyridoxamine 5'-phosphate oxidase superfamily)
LIILRIDLSTPSTLARGMYDVGVAMSEAQIEAFLTDHVTGVLAVPGSEPGEPPDSLPVAYGYDRRNDAVVFPLSADGSVTDRPESAGASLTVHDRASGVRSVVLSGELRALPGESVDRATRIFETHGPDRQADGHDPGPTDPEWYTIADVEKTGRQPAQAGPSRPSVHL